MDFNRYGRFSLPEAKSLSLKIDGWKMRFPFVALACFEVLCSFQGGVRFATVSLDEYLDV